MVFKQIRVGAIQIKLGFFYATLKSELFALCPTHTHTHTHTLFLRIWPTLDTSAACLTTVRNDKIAP